ncbi:MAG: ComEC/Rec2 family competence protein, partial [Deltaproteobacteria bacterium]|nr:ComEC/Rec2 family competence protein [Deltaproteobacteria bacterium]
DNRAKRLLTRLVSFFLVSFFAICGSLPLVAYYFNQISLVGLAANFLVVPLVGFVAIPLGLVALFVSPLSPLAGAWCIKAGAVTLGYALEIVRFFAELPFAAVKTFTPSILEIVCFYILGGALLNLLRAQPAAAAGLPNTAAEIANNDTGQLSGSPSAETGILGRPYNFFKGFAGRGLLPGQLAKAAVILVLLVLAADTCYWLYQRFWHPDLRVSVIDVGTGSAS